MFSHLSREAAVSEIPTRQCPEGDNLATVAQGCHISLAGNYEFWIPYFWYCVGSGPFSKVGRSQIHPWRE